MRSLALLLVAACRLVHSGSPSDEGPIVGILGVPASLQCNSVPAVGTPAAGQGSCFNVMYAKWVQQAGARTVAIPYNMRDTAPERLDGLLGALNGFLFTGGTFNFTDAASADATAYYRTASAIFDGVQRRTDAGSRVPLHGTCMGFQLLAVLAAGGEVLLGDAFDSEDLSLPLNLTLAARTSRWLGALPPAALSTLATQPVTSNLHHDGVPPDFFDSNPALRGYYTLLASNVDRKGRAFGSAFEARRYPIYATQFHPERPQFEWAPGRGIAHSAAAVDAMAQLAVFFVEQARGNAQRLAADEVVQWAEAHDTDTLPTVPVGGALSGYRAYAF